VFGKVRFAKPQAEVCFAKPQADPASLQRDSYLILTHPHVFLVVKAISPFINRLFIMVTCIRCTKFVTQLQFGGWCCECLISVGLKPKNMATQLPERPANHFNIIPSFSPNSPVLVPQQPPAILA
jgi:hypothetical protein